MSIYITFYSGVGSVTGANFLLELSKDNQSQRSTKILVDCGLIQGDRVAQARNREKFAYDPKDIDMLFVTHAHLDHVGRIPKLVKDGFTGVIYSTEETMKLAELILTDALSLLSRDAIKDGLEALYEKDDMIKAFSLWRTIPYYTETNIELNDDSQLTVYLKDAGHILGSSMIQFKYNNKNILFTGDLGNSPTPLLRDTDSISGSEYIVMESVYGDRNHESKEERENKLKDIINNTMARGGTLVIPAFSLERTQVILYEINKLVESKSIPQVPVFMDSPLAIKVTDIYKNSIDLFNERARGEISGGDDIFNFPKLSFTVSSEDSKTIDHTKSPKIIIAGSGMSVGGRVIHHEEMYLPDSKNTILLV
ncbi:MAG: MBL fold metallo-hydrolase, partial [Patescibacteria group bacterium]